MNKYIIIYDTWNSTGNTFEIEANFEQDAWDAFYYEVETEVEVTWKHIYEVEKEVKEGDN